MSETATAGKTIKQKADEEAARAEAEEPEVEEPEVETSEPDDDDDTDPEHADPEPEPEAKKKKTPSLQEQFQTDMQSFRKRWAKKFDLPDLQEPPYPGVVGFMLPGFAVPKTHANYTMCLTCNGIGKVLTQANTGKEENDFHVCPDTRCAGRGYWEKQSAVQDRPATGPLAVAPPPAPTDEWAEAPAWMGDPSLSAGA